MITETDLMGMVIFSAVPSPCHVCGCVCACSVSKPEQMVHISEHIKIITCETQMTL